MGRKFDYSGFFGPKPNRHQIVKNFKITSDGFHLKKIQKPND